MPKDRQIRKRAILATFDSLKSDEWPGLPTLARRFGVTRQYIARLLSEERRGRYFAMKGPHGRRTDLYE